MTLVCALLFVLFFKFTKVKKFEEIDVERINIVEGDGKPRMVIFKPVTRRFFDRDFHKAFVLSFARFCCCCNEKLSPVIGYFMRRLS